MAITTSTTATTATTMPATTASVTKSAASSLLKSLGTGSDLDIGTLVPSLVEAQFAARRMALTQRQDTLTAQISGVATLKNTITEFAKALDTLVRGGTLTSQPVSSAPSTLTATALPGAALAGRTASVRVDRLAASQTAVTVAPFDSASATIGTGTLTITTGGKAVPIAIGADKGTPTGIAAAINANKEAGVTASVVTDASGKAYLSLRGATGAAQAFTVTSTSETGDLSVVDVGGAATNSTITQAARNAQLTVDGIAVERASNEVADVVEGMKLTLVAESATAVTLTSTTPTAALTGAVKDFVATYNEVLAILKEQTDPVTGPLRADPAARQMGNMLRGLASTVLLPGAAAGSPSTLAAIGVRTTRQGTLEVDEAALTTAMTRSPEAVEAMFAVTTVAGTGLQSAMESMKFNANSFVYGLGAAGQRYSSAKTTLAQQATLLEAQTEKLTTRMTAQFSAMNTRVSAYKATQSYLQQQVDMWTKSG